MTFLFSKTHHYIRHLLKDIKTVGRRKWIKKVLTTTSLVIFLIMLFMAVTFSGIGVLSSIQAQNTDASVMDISTIPDGVIQDARDQAARMYGRSWKAEEYVDQLLNAYLDSIDEDFVIMFNPGGWGTKSLHASTGWTSIVQGIENSMSTEGYRVIALNYQRTNDNLQGKLHEIKEMITGYLGKADELAESINFLTRNNPNLRVVLAGESMGTMICDSAMNMLKDNKRVFSIQTGSPPWQHNTIIDRTVLINNNGVMPDAFHNGDLWAIIKSSFQTMVGIEKPENRGEILGFISAPGHDYRWGSPGVVIPINTFISSNFAIQSKR